MFGRRKVAMVVAEFLGTGILALVVLSVQRSTIGIPYFVALAAGLAVAGLSLGFAAVSGAHFNPAITIGLWSARRIKTLPALVYVIAQLLGGWAAYGVYTYFVNNSLQKLTGHYSFRVFLAEAVGAFIFALVWAAVAAQRLKASVVGAGFALGIIVAAAASIGIVNPAVAISARAWAFWGGNGWWVYALGPVVGGIVGFNLYQLLFAANEPAAVKLATKSTGATTVGTANASDDVAADDADAAGDSDEPAEPEVAAVRATRAPRKAPRKRAATTTRVRTTTRRRRDV